MGYSLDVVASTPFSKGFIDSKHFFKEKILKEHAKFRDLDEFLDYYTLVLGDSYMDKNCELFKNISMLIWLTRDSYLKDGFIKLPKNNTELPPLIRFYYHKIMDYLIKTN